MYAVDRHDGIALRLKKEILPSVATWMILEAITLSEISQSQTYTVWFPFCEISKIVTDYQTGRQADRRTGAARGRRGDVESCSVGVKCHLCTRSEL